MLHRILARVVAILILCGAAVATAQDAAKPAVEATSGLLPEVDEAQGECKTPRQAWLQLLYWQQPPARNDSRKAALCFDTSQLRERDKMAPELASQLKQVLDANAWYIQAPQLSTDPNYVDPVTGHMVYEDPVVRGKGIELHKRGDRWLFTPATLDIIPELFPGLVLRIVNFLPMWFQTRLLNVQIWQYLGVMALLFIALVVQKTVVLFVRNYVRRLASKSNIRYFEEAVTKIARPIGGLVMAPVLYIGLPKLLFSAQVSRIGMVATKALAAYSAVWFAYRIIDVLRMWMEEKAERTESKLDDQLVPLIAKTLKVFVSVIGGIFVLQNLNVDVSSLLAGLGLGGLAFALAAKDTIANFFGSVMIFIDKPFQIGDWVTISGVEGIVEEVGFRTTRVRTFYNSVTTVPNSLVVGSTVDNYGVRTYRRYSTTLGLAYDTPPDKVQAFCEAVRASIAGMPGMRKDYYMVEFREFAASSLNIMVYCFMVSADWNEECTTRTALNLEILRIARSLGVSFAFPTQTLHIETRAKEGESRPSHSGPTERSELAEIVREFGPGGSRAHPTIPRISRGFYCGDDFDAETTAGRGGDG